MELFMHFSLIVSKYLRYFVFYHNRVKMSTYYIFERKDKDSPNRSRSGQFTLPSSFVTLTAIILMFFVCSIYLTPEHKTGIMN